MLDNFLDVFKIINTQIFLLSILLFFIGYAIAPFAYFKKIKWLTSYPFFLIRLIEQHFNKEWHPLKIFLVIFVLNSISLLINLVSAFGIILPVLFSIYLGINLGIVMYHTLDGKFYYLSLLNPVAIIELPAVWISYTMAIQYSAVKYFNISWIEPVPFAQYFTYFIFTVIPLLLIAAIIETVLIIISRKFERNSDDN